MKSLLVAFLLCLSLSAVWPRPQAEIVVRTDAEPARKFKGKSLLLGTCDPDDSLVYVDNTIVENSGPGVLNGTIEIYIDAPVSISCIKLENQMDEESAAVPTLNSGGLGHNWVFIDVACKYNLGFHFYIEIYGKYTKTGALMDENGL